MNSQTMGHLSPDFTFLVEQANRSFYCGTTKGCDSMREPLIRLQTSLCITYNTTLAARAAFRRLLTSGHKCAYQSRTLQWYTEYKYDAYYTSQKSSVKKQLSLACDNRGLATCGTTTTDAKPFTTSNMADETEHSCRCPLRSKGADEREELNSSFSQ